MRSAPLCKQFFKTKGRKIMTILKKLRTAASVRAAKVIAIVCNTRAENFVDSGIKILIAVVIGALLLSGLYALFGDTIMPTVTQKVQEMFNFQG